MLFSKNILAEGSALGSNAQAARKRWKRHLVGRRATRTSHATQICPFESFDMYICVLAGGFASS